MSQNLTCSFSYLSPFIHEPLASKTINFNVFQTVKHIIRTSHINLIEKREYIHTFIPNQRQVGGMGRGVPNQANLSEFCYVPNSLGREGVRKLVFFKVSPGTSMNNWFPSHMNVSNTKKSLYRYTLFSKFKRRKLMKEFVSIWFIMEKIYLELLPKGLPTYTIYTSIYET